MRINSPRQASLTKLNTTVSLATQANAYRKTIRAWWVDRNTYSISIPAREPFYMDVRQWLMTLIPQVSQRSVGLVTAKSGSLVMIHDSDKSQSFSLKGHKVTVNVVKPPKSFSELMEQSAGSSLSSGENAKEEQVIFTCYSVEGQQALLGELRELQEKNRKKVKVASIRTFGRWGDWTNYVELPKRSLESVILSDGQSERVVNDIQGFLDSEDDYVRLGLPYHRGYLFSGPPGTGKSSFAKVLASHFNMDLWYLPLGSVNSDHSLMSVINAVHSRSILLLEDVDVFSGMTERTDDKNSFTMSGLLNTLDGVATPHGLISILTTNDASKLDPAITRPGRVDLHEQLGYLEPGQAERLFEAFYGRQPSSEFKVTGYAPASLMDVFKRNMKNAAGAEAICIAGDLDDWTEDDNKKQKLLRAGGALINPDDEVLTEESFADLLAGTIDFE